MDSTTKSIMDGVLAQCQTMAEETITFSGTDYKVSCVIVNDERNYNQAGHRMFKSAVLTAKNGSPTLAQGSALTWDGATWTVRGTYAKNDSFTQYDIFTTIG